MKMYAQRGWLLVLIGLALSGPHAYAAQQIWVSLGSFSKVSGAAELHNRASSVFSQLSVVPSDSSIGMVYRVVDGPVSTRAEAEAKLEQARMMGIFDAWLLVKDDSFVMPAGVEDAQLVANGPTVSNSAPSDSVSNDSSVGGYSLQDSVSGAVLGEFSSSSDNSNFADSGPANDDDYESLPLGKQELVETAPPGYGLHQLRRGGAMPAGPAVESRLSELEGIGGTQNDN